MEIPVGDKLPCLPHNGMIQANPVLVKLYLSFFYVTLLFALFSAFYVCLFFTFLLNLTCHF